MEGEKKSNTAMLTVIAIATLLVAVVGATFAYFSASTTNTGDVTVTAETKAADIFSATGNGTIGLTVNASDMQFANKSDSYNAKVTGTNATALVVSLEAGSGSATCEYDLTYTPSSGDGIDSYVKSSHASTNSLLEYTVSGTDGTQTVNEQNLDGTFVLNGNTKLSITDTAGSGATTQSWTFTNNFYNLAGDQSSLAGKTFQGVISVTGVSCTNTANS